MPISTGAKLKVDDVGIGQEQATTPVTAPQAEPTSESDMPRCPDCGWQNVRRSPRRTPLDFALSAFSITPFRCRSCNSRFYRFHKHSQEE